MSEDKHWHADSRGGFRAGKVSRRALLAGTGVAVMATGGLSHLAAATPALATGGTVSGDTHPAIDETYPPSVFRHSNPHAHWVDVTKVEEALGAPPGTNAVPGDPGHDSSTAFRFALDYLKSLIEPYGNDATNQPSTTLVLYVPNGTYYVRQSVGYTGRPLLRSGSETQSIWVHMRIVGQSRDGAVVRLVDGAKGFGAGESRPVVDFSRGVAFDNWSAQTVLRNLTVATGRSNPGAVGVDFYGANNARIDNVRIVSDDGQGQHGLHVRIGITSGYYSNLLVEGFDHGITVEPYHFANPFIEHVTLRGQRVAAIKVADSTPALRDVHSTNDCPAVLVSGAGAHVVVVDATLQRATASGAPSAVEMTAPGHVFLRNVSVHGYPSAVRRLGAVAVHAAHITEWVSDPVITFDEGQRKRSLGLSVEEPPVIPRPALREWADVTDFGAVGDGIVDDSAAVQRAVDSGAPVVLFPNEAYLVGTTVRVPGTVKRLALVHSSVIGVSAPIFKVAENADQALVVDAVHRVGGSTLIEHEATRTVSLDTIRSGGAPGGDLYMNHHDRANGDAFFSNVNGLTAPTAVISRQRAWGRWINSESKQTTNFAVGAEGILWVMGYKVEGGTINYDVSDGGVLEVLGGLANQYGRPTFNDDVVPDIVIRSRNGNVSAVLASNGPNLADSSKDAFNVVVDDIEDGVQRTVYWTDLPPRVGRGHQWVLPLYVSYDSAVRGRR